MVKESKYGNYIVPAIVFVTMAATFDVRLLHYLNTAARNNATCVFDSVVVFSLVD